MRTTALLAAIVAFTAFASASTARADEPSEADLEAAIAKEHAELESQLTFRTGTIALVDGKVQLALPEGYRFLGPDDAQKVLVAWGNLKGEPPLGMLLPEGAGLWDDGSLAILVEYNDDGHVSDDDAASTDFEVLLAQMKDGARAGSKARVEQGLSSVALVGWAEPPHYDKASRKLYWAKELEFGGSPAHTLNYDVRVLGREGALELSAIASIDMLALAKEEMQRVLGFADFTKGNLYTDYKEGSDRSAGYGIAAVVAGGVAAKVIGGKGFFAMLLGAKKLLLAGAIALAALVKALWSRLSARRNAPGHDAG